MARRWAESGEAALATAGAGPASRPRADSAALSSGAIGGAGLDVFEHEPAVPPALLAMPNVAVTPHMGADTEAVQTLALRLVMDNLAAFFANRPLLTPVY